MVYFFHYCTVKFNISPISCNETEFMDNIYNVQPLKKKIFSRGFRFNCNTFADGIYKVAQQVTVQIVNLK
jgi:hypothetical protein